MSLVVNLMDNFRFWTFILIRHPLGIHYSLFFTIFPLTFSIFLL